MKERDRERDVSERKRNDQTPPNIPYFFESARHQRSANMILGRGRGHKL